MPKLSKTKVIMLSTSAWQEDIDFCLGNGANTYYVKPTNLATLQSYIKHVCDDNRVLVA